MTPAVVVCEPTHRWAVAWRVELARQGPRRAPPPVVETRHLAACREELLARPGSVAAVAARAANAAAVAESLAEWRGACPSSAAMVLAEAGALPSEWLLREAGAWHVVPSPWQLAPAVRFALRQLARAVPPPGREFAWPELPWPECFVTPKN